MREAKYTALVDVQAEQKAASKVIEQQFANARHRLERLEEENTQLLREKARLEGQLNKSRQR